VRPDAVRPRLVGEEGGIEDEVGEREEDERGRHREAEDDRNREQADEPEDVFRDFRRGGAFRQDQLNREDGDREGADPGELSWA